MQNKTSAILYTKHLPMGLCQPIYISGQFQVELSPVVERNLINYVSKRKCSLLMKWMNSQTIQAQSTSLPTTNNQRRGTE